MKSANCVLESQFTVFNGNEAASLSSNNFLIVCSFIYFYFCVCLFAVAMSNKKGNKAKAKCGKKAIKLHEFDEYDELDNDDKINDENQPPNQPPKGRATPFDSTDTSVLLRFINDSMANSMVTNAITPHGRQLESQSITEKFNAVSNVVIVIAFQFICVFVCLLMPWRLSFCSNAPKHSYVIERRTSARNWLN